MRYWPPFIFLCTAFLCSSGRAVSGPPERTADSLRAAGNFTLASLYYEEAAFISTETQRTVLYTMYAAECLKHAGLYREAYTLVAHVPGIGISDSLQLALRVNSAIFAYLDGEFGAAEAELLKIDSLQAFCRDSAFIALLRAFILHELHRWDEAKQIIAIHAAHRFRNDPMELHRKLSLLDSLYGKYQVPRLKDPDKAIALATWLPGFGQVYAGRPLEGMVSAGAMLATTAGMVAGVLSQYYFTSIVAGNMLLGKFYQGSLSRTELLVKQTNYRRVQPFNFRLKRQLSAAFGNQ